MKTPSFFDETNEDLPLFSGTPMKAGDGSHEPSPASLSPAQQSLPFKCKTCKDTGVILDKGRKKYCWCEASILKKGKKK